MKKTLAAILAAAMALSMSAVAFAQDYPTTGEVIGGAAAGTTNGVYDGPTQAMGSSKTYLVNPGDVTGRLTDGAYANVDAIKLASLMNNKKVVVDVSVSAGKSNLSANPTVKVNKNNEAVLNIGFTDTWGIDNVDATMRIRITAKADITIGDVDGTGDPRVFLKKGDTITLSPFRAEGTYYFVDEYSENMTITSDEVSERRIKVSGEELYNNADSNDKVIIYFGGYGHDVAAFEGKISPNQKNLNLGYDTNEITAITNEYKDLEFEFINFKAQVSGYNRFNNSGTMYFNAINGADTTVYEYADGVLTKMDGKYDSVDGTVAVSGIKYLTTYVIASEELPEDEPEEESSSPAPSEEVPSTPVGNPSTGAL